MLLKPTIFQLNNFKLVPTLNRTSVSRFFLKDKKIIITFYQSLKFTPYDLCMEFKISTVCVDQTKILIIIHPNSNMSSQYFFMRSKKDPIIWYYWCSTQALATNQQKNWVTVLQNFPFNFPEQIQISEISDYSFLDKRALSPLVSLITRHVGYVMIWRRYITRLNVHNAICFNIFQRGNSTHLTEHNPDYIMNHVNHYANKQIRLMLHCKMPQRLMNIGSKTGILGWKRTLHTFSVYYASHYISNY